MVSINTNLSSLIVQNNLSKSTNALNQAIERMTTGYKINHASDNAANYSIAQNMNSKISSYQIADENVSMGLDLVTTAQDTISLMQDHGQRIHALITQAQNGTYGASSLAAINSEINARIAEIDRLYATTEYNGVNLLENPLPDWADEVKANAGNISVRSDGFIADPKNYTDDEVAVMTSVSEVTGNYTSGTIYKISSAEELAKLAADTNSGKSTNGAIFVLANDIDLASYCAEHEAAGGWTAIGTAAKAFEGTFDGNGHKISNLTINRSMYYNGLFGATGASAILKNVGIENCNVDTGGNNRVGGLVGDAQGTIDNCYVTGVVKGGARVGGLAGYINSGVNSISNCYAAVDVVAQGVQIGGLIGSSTSDSTTNITKCFAIGNVSGEYDVGGLIGSTYAVINNCYASGNISGKTNNAGGLAGSSGQGSSIKNSYATGNVSTTEEGVGVGGLIGGTWGEINNCYATGNVSGSSVIGGLIGWTTADIKNSYATGDVTGERRIGGLVGKLDKTSGSNELDELENVFSSGSVSGNERIGSLIGDIYDSGDGTSFFTINITNAYALSQGGIGMIGYEAKSDGTPYESGQMETWLANIQTIQGETTLQVGIDGRESSQITCNTRFSYNLSQITAMGAQNSQSYNVINNFLNKLSEKATSLGAVSNRLESALESISVATENLVSSRSTLQDADIAKESSAYIKSQILQQASATLLATANQTPSVALTLLGGLI